MPTIGSGNSYSPAQQAQERERKLNQNLDRIQELAKKHNIQMGRQPMVTDLLLVLEKLDTCQMLLDSLLARTKADNAPF